MVLQTNSSEFYWENPKEEEAMLHIIRSSLALKKELRPAIDIVKDIIAELDALTPTSNLTKKIGPFTEKIKNLGFKVLEKDGIDAIRTLRTVCSGELEVSDALLIFTKAYDELKLLEVLYENFSGEITLPDE